MSDISIFTAVKYADDLKNTPAKGWCVKQLDNWTFPIFGSEVEVIEFDKDLDIARYQEKTTQTNIFTVAFRIFLLVTVVFPVIVLITRAITRHNIDFKKPESKINQVNICLLEEHAGKEIKVPLGKPFSIKLWHSPTTGHSSWEMSQIPSFINHVKQYVIFREHPPGFCGGGDDYVFVFEPKGPGRGDIVMKLPCLGFDPGRIEEKRFSIIAD